MSKTYRVVVEPIEVIQQAGHPEEYIIMDRIEFTFTAGDKAGIVSPEKLIREQLTRLCLDRWMDITSVEQKDLSK